MLIWVTPDRFDRKPDKSSWLEMARHLSSAGHKVTILTSGASTFLPSKDKDLIAIVRAVDIPLVFRISVLLNMFLWIRANGSPGDIVIVNPDALWLVPVLRILGIRHIHLDIRTLPVDVQGFKNRLDKLLFWTWPLKFLGGLPVSYSFITERLRAEAEKTLGRQIDEYVIWQSGVNGTVFSPKPATQGSKTGRKRLFYHGTISINRGIGAVIEAMALIDPKLDVEFVIVGDGNGTAELKAMTHRLHLTDRVIFRGLLPYERMVDEINQADLCICPLPDRLEWNVSSPLKVFEYMACAKPMVLTPIAAHRDVLAEKPFVVWSEGFQSRDIALGIEKALSNLEKLTQAATAGPRLVSNHHDWAQQANTLERHLMHNNTIATIATLTK